MVTFLAFCAYMFSAVKILDGLVGKGQVPFAPLLGLIGSAIVVVATF